MVLCCLYLIPYFSVRYNALSSRVQSFSRLPLSRRCINLFFNIYIYFLMLWHLGTLLILERLLLPGYQFFKIVNFSPFSAPFYPHTHQTKALPSTTYFTTFLKGRYSSALITPRPGSRQSETVPTPQGPLKLLN